MVAIELHLLISQIVSHSPEIKFCCCFGLRSKVELALNSSLATPSLLQYRIRVNNYKKIKSTILKQRCVNVILLGFRNLHLSATKEVKPLSICILELILPSTFCSAVQCVRGARSVTRRSFATPIYGSGHLRGRPTIYHFCMYFSVSECVVSSSERVL